jgi:hypothetical protein
MGKQKPKDPSGNPEWAEFLLTEVTAIKKARFLLSDGGTVEIGIFHAPDGNYTMGAYLRRDENGEVHSGTVCKTQDASGLEWYRSLLREFMLRIPRN